MESRGKQAVEGTTNKTAVENDDERKLDEKETSSAKNLSNEGDEKVDDSVSRKISALKLDSKKKQAMLQRAKARRKKEKSDS